MASSDGDLSEIFKKSCNVGASAKQAGKTTMTTANLTKWFKSCKIYGTKLTSTDTDIAFQKVKSAKTAKEITLAEFEKLLKEIAPKYKADKKLGSDDEAVAAMKKKLMGGIDAKSGTTKTSATGGVAKMTDTSQYTGSHKERFDESGKGKGLDGRVDKVDGSGYVGNYKGEGTYDEKH